ncbi:MAG: hypothetical protein ACP5XB_08650 [Isosphaeraceae bacterium]
MFEQIFDQYRKVVESSFETQQDLYREWMNGLPIKPPDLGSSVDHEAAQEHIRTYRERWNETLAEMLEQHRKALNEQYQQGIQAIEAAFRTTEAKTPEEFWRLTQEFWRKSIDSFKTALQIQTKYVQNLASMWFDLITRGKV